MGIVVTTDPDGVKVFFDGTFSPWVGNANTNIQVEYGDAFIMEGGALQTVTLPPPAAGSKGKGFAITGDSLAFFRIAQNATQFIFGTGGWTTTTGVAGTLKSTDRNGTLVLICKDDLGTEFAATTMQGIFDIDETGTIVSGDGFIPQFNGELMIGNESGDGHPTPGALTSLNNSVTFTPTTGGLDLDASSGAGGSLTSSISSSFYTKRIEDTFNEDQLTGIGTGYTNGIYYKEKGLIFFFPGSANNILIVDIVRKTFSIAPTVVPAGSGKWSRAIRAWNNKVFLIPNNFLAVGIFDMDALTLDTVTIPVNIAPFNQLYGSGYVAPNNGMIYCPPTNSASGIMKIDPFNLTVSFFGPGFPGDNNKFNDVVLSSYNGLGYCVPRQKDFVGIINSFNDTWDTTTIVGLVGTNKWFTGEEGSDLNLYFGAFSSNATLIVDPITDTFDDTTIVGFNGRTGSSAASNDKLYFCGGPSTNVLILDVQTQTAENTSISGVSTGYGKLLATDMGELISTPSDVSGTSLVIQTGLPKISIDWAISAYSNR